MFKQSRATAERVTRVLFVIDAQRGILEIHMNRMESARHVIAISRESSVMSATT